MDKMVVSSLSLKEVKSQGPSKKLISPQYFRPSIEIPQSLSISLFDKRQKRHEGPARRKHLHVRVGQLFENGHPLRQWTGVIGQQKDYSEPYSTARSAKVRISHHDTSPSSHFPQIKRFIKD
jgi:hypothetical protein